MKVGVVADDFAGTSDIARTPAKAGGEASKAVAAALGVTTRRVSSEIAPHALGEPGMALESGKLGGETFFEDALQALDGGA